ncbi:MAG: hypothetical protein LBT46_00605 [Planctomycetaceae bacterium]|nr:hypothetical protein [Planctomycetaceae bacterium]
MISKKVSQGEDGREFVRVKFIAEGGSRQEMMKFLNNKDFLIEEGTKAAEKFGIRAPGINQIGFLSFCDKTGELLSAKTPQDGKVFGTVTYSYIGE